MRLVRRSDLTFAFILTVMVGVTASVLANRLGFSPGWGAVVALIPLIVGVRRSLRRYRAVQAPFSDEARAWLEAHVPLFTRVDEAAQQRFVRDVQIVMAESAFEGIDGVEVTETLKLAVGAGAALMLHGRPDWELPRGRTFLFYPGTFDDDYETDEVATYDGMVHPQGPVLLSAPAVEWGWSKADGYNVVLHELAHLFDFEAQGADGIPSLMDPGSSDAWRKLVKDEMRRVRLGTSILRRYASSNPAELFAVSVEQFFERPVRLQRHHPVLFDALVALFNLDPRTDAESVDPAVQDGGPSLMARRWGPSGARAN